MIKIENFEVMGWDHVIRGMRNPMNSWDKSDSGICKGGDDGIGCNNCADCGCDHSYDHSWQLGKADHKLMMKLARAGSVHGKFRRMITVYMDITAPLYWWKEFDTYKVGTVANSCSTMHKIHAKEFTLEDFSCEHLLWSDNNMSDEDIPVKVMENLIYVLNHYRRVFLDTKDKTYWWQMIQLLPSSYNQRRTVTMSYENVFTILRQREGHKLDEWNRLWEIFKGLPYVKEIGGIE